VVAFEIDGIDPAARLGWSALVQGPAHRVESEAERASALRAGVELFVRIISSRITGRRIRPA
jgi:hypothetical protein